MRRLHNQKGFTEAGGCFFSLVEQFCRSNGRILALSHREQNACAHSSFLFLMRLQR